MYKIECTRCFGGKGIISAFRHVHGGVCFKCAGCGYTLSRTSPEARAKAMAKRQASEHSRQSARIARIAHRAELSARHANDARIGPLARDYIDAGTYTGDASRFLRNITG